MYYLKPRFLKLNHLLTVKSAITVIKFVYYNV